MNITNTINNLLSIHLLSAGYKALCALSCLMILWGCATAPKGQDIIAIVDGEPITIEDLEYSLQVSHRREELPSTGELDIPGFVQKLINDRLIVQEARRMGMEDYPEVRQRIDAYILGESVSSLYNDEIVQKVSVSESEIEERFRHDYERFTLGMIAAASEEDAAGIMEQLKKGEDFNELALQHSVDFSENKGEKILRRKEIAPAFENVISDLKAGEISDIMNIKGSFYIVKLIKREEAGEKDYEGVRKELEEQIRKLKIDRRSDEYLAELRSRADIDIDREILDSIKIDDQGQGMEKWLKDDRILVKVNNGVIRVGEFAAKLSAAQIDQKEDILNNWIDNRVVDQEALSRKYETKPGLEGRLQRYKVPVIRNLFVSKMIVPGIKVSRAELDDYYLKHKEEFIEPLKYRIQQISVQNITDARSITNSLAGGADFSWLAKKWSIDNFAANGGIAGWNTKQDLPAPAAEIVDTLRPGDYSPILEIDGFFRIIRLIEKGEAEFQDFSKVKNTIHKRIYLDKYNIVYNEYVDKLKKGVKIDVDQEKIESFANMFKN